MELEEEQRKIVEKSLIDKIIVNAPPGSGKTETIIQKLVYIYQNNITDLKNVLVICFSRAAVKEIKDRVERLTGIKNRIEIRTIDSFCSIIIKELEDDYKGKFTKMNYEDRIEYVTSLLEINPRLRSKIKHLKHIIIDEFQDIVECRAKFILGILQIHENGFSLFGDECQAIFNYQAEEMTSDKLIEEIVNRYPDCERIEYKIQHRENSKEQKEKNNGYRDMIKQYQDKPKRLNDFIKQIILPEIQTKEIDGIENKKIAILTRQNGQVYEIAKYLNGVIPYKIQDYNNYIIFPGWIGYILCDYQENNITKEQFKKLVKTKLNIGEIESYWNYCKEIENSQEEDELDLQLLKENMIIDKGQYPDTFQDNNESRIIISTIHKAKGREYDEVYLHFKETDFVQPENNLDSILDNARILYVALTRAKQHYYKYSKEIRNTFFKSFKDGKQERYYSYVCYRNGIKKSKRVRKIEIGLQGDIDYNSFIDSTVVGDVRKSQEYIYNNIKMGDIVDLVKEGEKFSIFHKGRRIGSMNIENLFEKAIYDINGTKYHGKEVTSYREVRVKNVITVAKFSDYIEDKYELPYRETGLWNAIELQGFGRLEF